MIDTGRCIRLIGLCGPAGSGKSTLATEFALVNGWCLISFADPVRKMLEAMNPIVGDSRYLDLVNQYGYDEAKRRFPEVRALLQKLGTEAGRGVLGDDVWTKYATPRIHSGVYWSGGVVIDDVRMPNEAELVRELGGVVIRVQRDGVKALNGHSSERMQFPVDDVIENNRTVEETAEALKWRIL